MLKISQIKPKEMSVQVKHRWGSFYTALLIRIKCRSSDSSWWHQTACILEVHVSNCVMMHSILTGIESKYRRKYLVLSVFNGRVAFWSIKTTVRGRHYPACGIASKRLISHYQSCRCWKLAVLCDAGGFLRNHDYIINNMKRDAHLFRSQQFNAFALSWNKIWRSHHREARQRGMVAGARNIIYRDMLQSRRYRAGAA